MQAIRKVVMGINNQTHRSFLLQAVRANEQLLHQLRQAPV